MTQPFTSLDYALLAAGCLAMLALGALPGLRQRTSDGFLLAGRSLGWWLAGPSLALGGAAAMVYLSAPLDAYFSGARFMLLSLTVWAALPMVFWCTTPLYTRLDIDSVHEYLELRYDAATRATVAVAWCVWQVVLLAGVLVLPARLFGFGGAEAAAVIIGLGALAGVQAALGGMKGGAWTGAPAVALMAAVVVALVLLLSGGLDRGLPTLWETAERLGRATVIDSQAGVSETWSAWAAVPGLAILAIFFLTADQATLQRFFSTRSELDMKVAWLVGATVVALVVPVATYVGLGLLAHYQTRAQAELPPYWVASLAVEPTTGRPLLGPDTPITAESIDDLVAKGLILDPNTGRPFESTEGLVNPRGEVVIDRLARRTSPAFGGEPIRARRPPGRPRPRGGERILQRGEDQLLAQFLGRHVHAGLRGLVMTAFFGVAAAAVGSGLVALGTVAVIDFHERFGWAEAWLARRSGKTPDELDQSDELRLARPLVAALGAVVVAAALLMQFADNVPATVLAVLGVAGGPVLAVFLLGIFTRRATGPGALVGLGVGAAAAGWVALSRLAPGLWPFGPPLGAFFPVLIGFGAAAPVGWLASLLLGRRKTKQELSGLVAGVGRLGILSEPDAAGKEQMIWIPSDDDASPPHESPWSRPVE